MCASSADDAATTAALRRLWVVATAFLLVAVVTSVVIGIPVRDPGGGFFVRRVALSVALVAGLVVLQTLLGSRAGHRRPRELWAVLRRRWTRRRLAVAGGALLAYHVVYLAYHNLKSFNDLRSPRDSLLDRVDEWLLLGHSPAVLLHDALGEVLAAHVLVAVYESFGSLVVLVVAGTVVLPRLRDGLGVLASMVWVWILGTASYVALPSLGPFHERSADFAGLPPSVVSRTQASFVADREHLIAHPGAGDAFGQIGAFASLHVAVTTVILLSAVRLGFRRSATVLGVYLALTCVATVYLGWHFLVDVPAGLLIGALAVWLGARTVRDPDPSPGFSSPPARGAADQGTPRPPAGVVRRSGAPWWGPLVMSPSCAPRGHAGTRRSRH